MKKKEFDAALRALLHHKPFQPFTVEMIAGENFTVDVPDAVAVNRGAGGYISSEKEIYFFDFRSVKRFITAARESA